MNGFSVENQNASAVRLIDFLQATCAGNVSATRNRNTCARDRPTANTWPRASGPAITWTFVRSKERSRSFAVRPPPRARQSRRLGRNRRGNRRRLQCRNRPTSGTDMRTPWLTVRPYGHARGHTQDLFFGEERFYEIFIEIENDTNNKRKLTNFSPRCIVGTPMI